MSHSISDDNHPRGFGYPMRVVPMLAAVDPSLVGVAPSLPEVVPIPVGAVPSLVVADPCRAHHLVGVECSLRPVVDSLARVGWGGPERAHRVGCCPDGAYSSAAHCTAGYGH